MGLNQIMRRVAGFFIFLPCILLLCGCGGSGDVLDPTQIGRFRPTPSVNVILESLGVAEETSRTFQDFEEPRPLDVIPYEQDYVFHPGDTIRVSIYELLQENQLYFDIFPVTETGKIWIPVVGSVQAAGLTESQLQKEITNILAPTILRTPSVSVSLQESQSRVFTILGDGIRNSGRYNIPRYDFKLTDALAAGGSPAQFNVSYVYVSRTVSGQESLAEEKVQQQAVQSEPSSEQTFPELESVPAEPKVTTPPQPNSEEELLEIIAPVAKRGVRNRIVISSAEFVVDKELEAAAAPEGIDPLDELDQDQGGNATSTLPEDIDKAATERGEVTGQIEWIFKDGKWLPVRVQEEQSEAATEKKTSSEPLTPQAPEKFGWDQIGTGGVQTRVMRIPVHKLLGGDPRYNIIIKPGDVITVPLDSIGEFTIMGNVNAQGYIQLTGRPMTLMQAIAAAGGLGALASPENVEVRRRISEKQEEIVLVNLKKIAEGSQPDFFIRPDDLVNVGTQQNARWLAVLRNAFRATYGFGFIYDRNFGDEDFGL